MSQGTTVVMTARTATTLSARPLPAKNMFEDQNVPGRAFLAAKTSS
jgi:hypothetical protein